MIKIVKGSSCEGAGIKVTWDWYIIAVFLLSELTCLCDTSVLHHTLYIDQDD